MKDKKIIIGVVIIALLLLGSGGYFILSKNKTGKPAVAPAPFIEEEEIEEIQAEDLGFTLELRPDKKAIKFTLANAKDVESVEYQISYNKDVDGEEVPEGLIGEAKAENGKVEIDYREFGTCSSGTCRYDKVIFPVKVTLKIVKTDGKVYMSEKSIDL